MSDIAREAGVSLVTVSRAINSPDKVAPKTLEAIRSVVERLGYVPNLMAGGLASNRSRIVAAIVPTIANLVFSEAVEALTRTLAGGGYQLLLGQSGYQQEEESALVETFLGRRVDGLVLTGLEQSLSLRDKLRRSGIPVVQTWDLPARASLASRQAGTPVIDMLVGFSNIEAGRSAGRHLIERGHRSFAFIGADEARSRLRLGGLQEAATEMGLPSVATELIRPPAQIDEAGASLKRLRHRRPDITAVFCNNDLLAAGALFACRQQGWDVPSRIAIMGFGDLPIARAAAPTLTTVQIRRSAMGACAGRMLLARMAGSALEAGEEDIGFKVVVREST